MAAVRQDLPLQLVDKWPFRKAQPALVAGDAQAGLRQPDQGQQPRVASGALRQEAERYVTWSSRLSMMAA